MGTRQEVHRNTAAAGFPAHIPVRPFPTAQSAEIQLMVTAAGLCAECIPARLFQTVPSAGIRLHLGAAGFTAIFLTPPSKTAP